MDERSQEDIRKLLRGFGIRADEAIREHLAARPGQILHLRVLLEDVTEDETRPTRLLEVDGEVRG